jgi:hypothetical protein
LYFSVLLQLTASASEFCSLIYATWTCIKENTSCDYYPLLLCDVNAYVQAAHAVHSNGL